jgi:ABC-type transporter Mla MlaB component
MLKVTILESPAEQRFVVEGKLTQPWVPELESAWESAREARRALRCVVDLSDTTLIDRSGRQLLMAMCREGVRFIAKGVYVKHLIKDLRRNGAKQAHCLFQDETEKAQ